MDDKLLEIFAEEAREIMDSLEAGLLSLESRPDPETINTVFRAAHTMKGNAGIVGFGPVVELTHLMEGVLDQMRQGERQPEDQVMGLLLQATDHLKGMVEAMLAGQEPRDPAPLLRELSPLVPGQAPPPVSAAPSSPPGQAPALEQEERRLHLSIKLPPDLFTTGDGPLQLLAELGDLGELERVLCHVEELPPFAELDPFSLYLWWEVWLKTSQPLGTVENIFMFVRDEGDISIAPTHEDPPPAPLPLAKRDPKPPSPRPSAPPATAAAPLRPASMAAPTIRVDTNKLDKLVNLVGEMVIGLARVSGTLDARSDPDLQSAVQSMEHISRDLQQQVMRVRMVPVEGTFHRFRRMVRDLAAKLGKDIRLELSGLETEWDKNVAERIVDPLKHLVRNAAGHGLEPPEQRRAAGKPAQGTIWLRAYQQQGRIFIEVADDGQGIDPELVLNLARERGLVLPEANPSQEEIYELLFHPGFTTAGQVTELSGRGVGLDVVRQNVESLRGSVEINSTFGQGTTFRIKLPLTLAIIDGMNVRVAGEVYVLPLLAIVESFRPVAGQLKTVEGRGEVLRLRDSYLPLVRLARLFRLEGGVDDPSQGLVVVIGSMGKRFGLLVDDILGEQQAVIKSLAQNYGEVPGVSGATILGDGRVALILDVPGLEKMALGREDF